jgi:hypothetical protein
MPKRSNKFQILIEMLERQLAQTDAKVTGSKLLLDARSGEEREVDIVIETFAGNHPIRIGIEVIDQGRRASSPWIESTFAKHADLPIDKTILVSRSGFYKPALLKAQSLKMETLTVQEAKDLDWKGRIDNLISIKMVSFLMPYPTGATIQYPDSEADYWANVEEHTKLSTIEVFSPNSDPRGTFASILDNLMASENFIDAVEERSFTDAGTVIEGTIQFEEGSYVVGPDGSRHSVLGIKFRAKCRKESGDISLDRGLYGDAAIAFGTGVSFGRSVQFAFTENCDDETLRAGIRIERTRSGKGSK